MQFDARGVRKGMVLPLNLTVDKVTERDGFRNIHLAVRNADLPAGFEAKDFVIRVPADTQDLTVGEANNE